MGCSCRALTDARASCNDTMLHVWWFLFCFREEWFIIEVVMN